MARPAEADGAARNERRGAASPVGAERFTALWRRTVANAASPDGASVYASLVAELGAPNRHFHNLEHVRDCIGWVDELAALLARRDIVELGLWFHDAILEPGAAGNERRSAQWFLALSAGAAASVRHGVSRLILATEHAARPQYGDRAFIVDIDLAGLAAPWDEFMHKGELLRREAAAQRDEDYYRSQVAFLGGLVQRPRLFATDYFRRTCEAAARANLQRLLALRASQGYASS